MGAATSLTPGIFVNLCPSESEDQDKKFSLRYFTAPQIQPAVALPRRFPVSNPQATQKYNPAAAPYTPTAVQSTRPSRTASPQPTERTNDTCKICGMNGHSESECSFKWRRYKLKTELSKPMLASVNENLNKWCYHCAQSGHFGDECMRKRLKSQFTAFHAPLFSLLSKAAAGVDCSPVKMPLSKEKRHSAKTSPVKPQEKQASTKRPKLAPNKRIKFS